MKTKIALIGLLIVFLSSCASPRYLPSSDNIDVNEYGSYIKLKYKGTYKIEGELIAIDSNKIVVLTKETKSCMTVSVSDVNHFQLRYATPKDYSWTIPAYTLATIGHGIWLIFTFPINLIVTISVTEAGKRAFKYDEKNIAYEKLKMFARFPQGIPSNIDLTSIK